MAHATEDSPSAASESLRSALAVIAHDPGFQANVIRLMGEKSRDEGHSVRADARWSLRLDRIAKERSTHWGLEATVVCEQLAIPLWGRLYKPIAHLKSWQRLIAPSYGRATWKILHRMHDRGLVSPMPIYYGLVKGRGWLPHRLLLAEHVGNLRELQEDLQNDSLRMDESGRMQLFEQLAQFANRLHAIGIYSFSLRYFHIAAEPIRTGRHKFYLCDLDKALLWSPSARGSIHRLLRRKDIDRLGRQIHRYAGQEAAEHFLAAIEGRRPGSRPRRAGT